MANFTYDIDELESRVSKYLGTNNSKLDTLNKNKQDKLKRLNPNSIDGMYDADSPLVDGGTSRLTQDEYYANAPELKVDGELSQEGINARIQADNYAMGIDAPNFKEGEGLNPKYYQQYVEAMNPAIQKRAIDDEYRLYDTGDKGKYGRSLVSAESEGMDESQTDYLLRKGQADKRYLDSGSYEKGLLKYSEPVEKGRIENILEAGQYGLGRKAAGITDAAVDAAMRISRDARKLVTGESEKEVNKKFQEDVKGTILEGHFDEKGDFVGLDKYKTAVEYGYDDTRTKEVMNKIGEKFDQKDYIGLAGEIASGVVDAGPEFVMESLGELATGVFGKLGLVLNAGDYTNQILEERGKVVDELGYKDRAIALTGGIAMGALNKVGADEIVGKTNVVRSLMQTVKASGTDNQVKEASKRILKAVAVAGGKGTYEGLEEVAQEAVSAVAERIGTEEADQILSTATGKRLVQAFGGGFGAGTTIGGAKEIAPLVKESGEIVKKGTEKVSKKVSDKYYGKDKEKKKEEPVDEETEYESNLETEYINVYNRAANGEDITENDVKVVEEAIASMEAVSMSPESVKKLAKLEKVVKDKYKQQLEDESPDVVLKSRDDIELYMEKAGLEENDEAHKKLFKLASKQGLLEGETTKEQIESYNKMKKDYYSVELDVTTGKRGYKTYARELDTLLDNKMPSSKAIKKKVKAMQKFKASQEFHSAELEKKIKDVEREIATFNSGKGMGSASSVIAKISKPVVINASGDTFKFHAKEVGGKISTTSMSGAKKILGLKEKNIDGIDKELRKRASRISAVGVNVADVGVATGLDVEVKGPMKKSLEKTQKAVDKLAEDADGEVRLIASSGKDGSFTSAIRSTNEGNINSTEYNEGDVAYIVVDNPKTQEEMDELVKDLSASKEMMKAIKAARRAGATIKLDGSIDSDTKFKLPLKKEKDGKKYRLVSAADVLREAIMMYNDAGSTKDDHYAPIGKSEGTIDVRYTFKPNKVIQGNKEEKQSKENAEKKYQERLTELYKLTLDGVADAEEMYKESEIKARFDSVDKLEKYLDNRRNKEVGQVVGYIKDIDSLLDDGGIKNLGEADKLEKELNSKDFHSKIHDAANKVIENEEQARVEVNSLISEMRTIMSNTELDEETKETEIQILLGGAMIDGNLVEDVLSTSASRKQGQLSFEYQKVTKDNVTTTKTRVSGNPEAYDNKVELDISNYVGVKNHTILQVIDPEVLIDGGEYKDYYKELKDWIKDTQVLEKEVKAYDNARYTKKQMQLMSSPAVGLVLDGNGKVNETVVLAMQLAFDEFVAFSANMLDTRYKSKADIANMVGMLEDQVSYEMYLELKEYGMFRKTLAEKIGSAAMSKMGLRFKKNGGAEQEAYRKLAADLGNMVILANEKSGALEEVEISAKKYSNLIGSKNYEDNNNATVSFIRFSNEVMSEDGDAQIAQLKEDYKEIHEMVGDDSSFRKMYRKSPVKVAKYEKDGVSKDISGREIPTGRDADMKSPKEFLGKLKEEEWRVSSSSIDVLLDMDDMVLKKYMGFKDEADLNKMSKESADSAIAKNREIENSIEELKALKDDVNRDSSVFFDWFYSKNGRYMMDSNTINPQSDKLHRFLVQPIKHFTEYVVKDGKFTANGKDVTGMVHYALAQAFGHAVDKKNTVSIQELGAKLVKVGSRKKDGKGELTLDNISMKQLKEAVVSGDVELLEELGLEAEHISHTVQAIEFLEGSAKGKFSSSLTAEFDAVTSGFGLKLLQFPIIDKLWDWLNKVGVFEKDSGYLKYKSMNDVLSDGKLKDSYQTLGIEMDMDAARKGLKDRVQKELWDSLGAALPQAIKENAEKVVSKQLRNLFKDPFMTFNYAAGLKSIKKSMARILMNQVLDGVVSGKKEYEQFGMELAELVDASSVEELVDALREDPIGSIASDNGAKIEKVLMEMFEQSYGAQVESIMTDKFGRFMEVNDTINASFKVMFAAFNDRYEEEKKKYAVGKLSEDQFLEILEKLEDEFPAIRGPLSSGVKDGIGIYDLKSKTPSIENTRYAPAQTRTGSDKKGERTKVIRHMIKDFEAAISAGSVIPIHYIDGGIMAQLAGMSITSIHDAIMPVLSEAEEAVGKYNGGVYDVSKGYSIMSEVKSMLGRLEGKDLGKTEINIKVGDKFVDMSIAEAHKVISGKVAKLDKEVAKAREGMFKRIDTIAHMAGTEGGTWKKGGKVVKPVSDIKEVSKQEDGTLSEDKERMRDLIVNLYKDNSKNSVGKILLNAVREVAEVAGDKAKFNTAFNEIIENC